MSNRFHFAASAFALVLASLVAPGRASAQACDAGWQCNVGYGASTPMDLYVPKMPAATPPIVVVLHYCGGHAADVHSWLQSYADQYGFLLIAPTAGGNCFDATPTRAGERANVAAMVSYTVNQKSADPKRVYVMGASSGACMTQALLAAYPDVFAAGSSLAGVPAGAWTGGNTYAWSTSGGGMPTTAQGWGDIVRNADKGFSGMRPRVQIWHGMGDTTLTYSQTYQFEVEQWTNVFGVTSADATMTSVKPSGAIDTWARTSYEDMNGTVVVEANSGASNVDHNLAGRGLWTDVVRFFGLDGSATASGGMGGASAGGAGGASTGGAGAGGAGAGGVGTGGRAGTGATSGGGNGNAGGSLSGAGGQAAGRGGMTATGGRGNTAGNSGAGAAAGGSTSEGGVANAGAAATAGASGTPGKGGSPNAAGETATGGRALGGGGASGGRLGASGAGATDSVGAGATGSGCGCRVAEREDGSLAALGASLAAGVALRRRRRRTPG